VNRALACLVLLCCAGLLAAGGRPADRPAGGPPPRPELRAEAQEYAQQLVIVAAEVGERYVRPVPSQALFRAALHGLYEAARVPIPASLDTDLKAVLDKTTTEGDLQGLVAFLARTRAGLGDPEVLRGPNALLVSCEAMVRALDPYSAVVRDEALRRGTGVDDQQGVGIELADNFGAGPLLIKAVAPGGPAQAAGLRPGDEITHLDGKPVRGLASAAAQLLCNQGAAAPDAEHQATIDVELTVVRPGTREPRKVTLERQEWRPETVLGVARDRGNRWDYFLDRERGIAHVRIANLGNGTALQVREVVTALRTAGMRGLILDLRWCPGGYLQEAVNLASLFVGEGKVATVRHRDGREDSYPSTAENKLLDFPMVALVNGETSGGGELIAAALQDHKRAVVAGQRTLGKGSVQSILPLGVPGAGLKLTTATFVRPSGKNLHRYPDSKPGDDWGVRPDPKMDCRVSPGLGRQLRGWWQQQDLRPGSSAEVLPLDDPNADPQRLAAVAVLRGMLK
jgi:carboxyl-terminal processing protease